MPKVTICIPARLGSSRLPRKVLLDDTGKPLILHTIEAAASSRLATRILVATDSEEVSAAVAGSGADVLLDTGDYWCGTARVAGAIAKTHDDSSVVVNLQADEPLVTGDQLDCLIEVCLRGTRSLATVVAPLHKRDWVNPQVVKARVDFGNEGGNCIDFARDAHDLKGDLSELWQHVGVYSFRAVMLDVVGALEQSERSRFESLEQLTWLDRLCITDIGAVFTDAAPLGINVRDDYDLFVEKVKNAND